MTIGEWFSRQYNTPPWKDRGSWSALRLGGDVTLAVTYNLQHPAAVSQVNEEPFCILTEKQKLLTGVDGAVFEDYFTDWRRPTEKEKQMFAMLTGIELFWSESNPFRWPTDEELRDEC